jgi:hypothetical protein
MYELVCVKGAVTSVCCRAEYHCKNEKSGWFNLLGSIGIVCSYNAGLDYARDSAIVYV